MEQKCVILTRSLPVFPVTYHVCCQMCISFLKTSLSFLSKHFVVIILMSSSSSLYLGKFILHIIFSVKSITFLFCIKLIIIFTYPTPKQMLGSKRMLDFQLFRLLLIVLNKKKQRLQSKPNIILGL